MSNIEQQTMDFKLELTREWLRLQSHKYRRPKWVKFPRAMLEDVRWIRSSDRAKAAWPSILVIASERRDSGLPEPELLYRRLRLLGHVSKKNSFAELIDEYIQCGFILKTTPELQSYRVTEKKESRKKEINGWTREEGKPSPHWTTPHVEEISVTPSERAELERLADRQHSPCNRPLREQITNYEAALALGSFRAPIGRFDRH